jgi:hypothetical protein
MFIFMSKKKQEQDVYDIRLNRFFKKRDKLNKILEARYNECDIKIHLKPNNSKNICNYCYRRLEYNPEDAPNSATAQYMGLKKIFHPNEFVVDAPIMREKIKRDLDFLKSEDYNRGIESIEKELIKKYGKNWIDEFL